MPTQTPWGPSQQSTTIVPGITFHSTAGHGGFKVSLHIVPVMPKEFQNLDGWYEEDCEASKVMLAFPHLFKEEQVINARRSFDFWFNADGTYKQRD